MAKEEKVREYYDNFSNDYNSFYRNIQYQKYEFVLSTITIKAESTIDVGGGTGLLSEFLGRKLLTIDISYQMLRNGTKNKMIENGIAADICFLPLRKNIFETVISFTAIQNTSDYNKSLFEIKRIGEKNCVLVITVLEKIIQISEFVNLLENNRLKADIIKLPVEDIGVIISNQL